MHFLYIIYSSTADKYYIGETNNVPARVEIHNSHRNIKAFTKAASDWKIQLIFKCRTKEEAVFLERFIKRMKSRKFTEKISGDPAILEDVLKKR